MVHYMEEPTPYHEANPSKTIYAGFSDFFSRSDDIIRVHRVGGRYCRANIERKATIGMNRRDLKDYRFTTITKLSKL